MDAEAKETRKTKVYKGGTIFHFKIKKCAAETSAAHQYVNT
jgi:hypothetical protein